MALVLSRLPVTGTELPSMWWLENLSVHETARLFALLNVALADAAIVCWDMKYACNFWRPVTAIHEADTDGNDRTLRDPDWRPLLDTPSFPSCTSGHSTFSGAAAQILSLFFGRDDIGFNNVSGAGKYTRSYSSFSQAAEEAGRSRIYGGIHFEFDNRGGLQSGRAVGQYIFDHFLKRLNKPTAGIAMTQTAFRPCALTMPGLLPGVHSRSVLRHCGTSRPSISIRWKSCYLKRWYGLTTVGSDEKGPELFVKQF